MPDAIRSPQGAGGSAAEHRRRESDGPRHATRSPQGAGGNAAEQRRRESDGPRQGHFITLEGGEGAGKTTQARRLAALLTEAGQPVLRTREPGGAPGAERIRALLLDGGSWDPVAEAMLHFAARREHLARTIRPALAAGITVISDRFADSTLAYQGGGQGLPRAVWDQLSAVALQGFAPDLTLILDLPPGTGMARAAGRGEPDRYERLGLGFHERVREAFLAIAAAEPARCVVVDASRDADAVFADLRAAVLGRLFP